MVSANKKGSRRSPVSSRAASRQPGMVSLLDNLRVRKGYPEHAADGFRLCSCPFWRTFLFLSISQGRNPARYHRSLACIKVPATFACARKHFLRARFALGRRSLSHLVRACELHLFNASLMRQPRSSHRPSKPDKRLSSGN